MIAPCASVVTASHRRPVDEDDRGKKGGCEQPPPSTQNPQKDPPTSQSLVDQTNVQRPEGPHGPKKTARHRFFFCERKKRFLISQSFFLLCANGPFFMCAIESLACGQPLRGLAALPVFFPLRTCVS